MKRRRAPPHWFYVLIIPQGVRLPTRVILALVARTHRAANSCPRHGWGGAVPPFRFYVLSSNDLLGRIDAHGAGIGARFPTRYAVKTPCLLSAFRRHRRRGPA